LMFSGVLSEGSLPGGFLFAADAFSLKFFTQKVQYCDWEHCRSDEYWIADEISAESQRQNRCYLNTTPQRKPRYSTDQRSMANEILQVSLEGRSRTNSPRQRFHSQLCLQIVRYFCRTLYKTGVERLATAWHCSKIPNRK
jgi:hypothetical protein